MSLIFKNNTEMKLSLATHNAKFLKNNTKILLPFILFFFTITLLSISAHSTALKSKDFNGIWAGGSVIKVKGNNVSIDMSSFNRPTARGKVTSSNTIKVNFPDDKTYIGKLVSKNRINWGGNNNWERIEKQISRFNGIWAGNSVIRIKGNNVSIDMSSFNRPMATGKVIGPDSIRVNFPDDRTYTGKLVSNNRINWGGNNNWDRVEQQTKYFNGVWAGGSVIKVKGSNVSIDMSSFNRPTAKGKVIGPDTIKVNFPDDKTYVGKLVSKNKINWGGNNNWERIEKQISRFNGVWAGNSVIRIKGNNVSIDMSSFNRPTATGKVIGPDSIKVNFPDDRTYTGKLVSKNRINWGGNNNWDRVQK